MSLSHKIDCALNPHKTPISRARGVASQFISQLIIMIIESIVLWAIKKRKKKEDGEKKRIELSLLLQKKTYPQKMYWTYEDGRQRRRAVITRWVGLDPICMDQRHIKVRARLSRKRPTIVWWKAATSAWSSRAIAIIVDDLHSARPAHICAGAIQISPHLYI